MNILATCIQYKDSLLNEQKQQSNMEIRFMWKPKMLSMVFGAYGKPFVGTVICMILISIIQFEYDIPKFLMHAMEMK